MVQTTVKKMKHVVPAEGLKGRKAILAVLARAADDSKFLAQMADNPTEALSGYYTLTQDEVAALVSGDIKRIEGLRVRSFIQTYMEPRENPIAKQIIEKYFPNIFDDDKR